MKRKLKMGMIGGGPGAFIGAVHRRAARMDGKIEIVAGAFDINPEKSLQMGRELCISPSRTYSDYKTMITEELKLPVGERVDFVSVTTPNNWHYPIAADFLKAGFNVMCEKPMTMDVKQAKSLVAIVKKTGKVFGLMHNYTGYPMVKLARDMVRQGDLGKIIKIVVQYPQGYLMKPAERKGQQMASWRSDPKQSGISGCMADIGIHAGNLAEYISGLKIRQVCADLTNFIPGNLLENDGNCLLRFDNGAKGLLHASQVSIGEENNLAIWVFGTEKSLQWHQENPNYLTVNVINGPAQVWKRGNEYIGAKSAAAARNTRFPFGHPEAFLEAFANNYCNFADVITARLEGTEVDPLALDFPQVEDGLWGMQFIEAVVKSAKLGTKWVKLQR
jgi:predicted dehydrogenase